MVLTSENHRKILLKVLEEAYLPKSVDVKKFQHLADHIFNNNVISFTDDDIPPEGTGHCKPLHIAILSSGYMLAGVLVDGGSSLNICPYATLLKMNVNLQRIRSNHTIIKAFDGSRRNSVGEIELPIEIGLIHFVCLFTCSK